VTEEALKHSGVCAVDAESAPCSAECSCGAMNRAEGFQVRQVFKSLLPGVILFGLALSVQQLWPAEDVATLGLYVLSYLLVGGDIVLKAVRNLLKGQAFDEFFLMTLATAGAFGLGAYAEAVAVMLFFKVGELFQEGAVARSRTSITSLIGLRPDFARIKTRQGLSTVDPAKVGVGQVIEVRPGERVPLDGTVISGQGAVDASTLTGEARPRHLAPGEEILSGMISTSAQFDIRVDRPLSESTVQRILDLVQDASGRKAETERFITRFARVYTPVVVLLALAIAFGPYAASRLPWGFDLVPEPVQLSDWIYRGLIFLVVSCPCALVISIPLGFFGGIGAASRQGILVKGGNFLEGLNRLGTVVWDKTGTLTRGRFTVAELRPEQRVGRDELIHAAAVAESRSSHPLAASVRVAHPLDHPPEVEEATETPGQGVAVTSGSSVYAAGNERFMQSRSIPVTSSGLSGTVIHVAKDDRYLGALVISDEAKPGAAEAVQGLRRAGISRQIMLTGDNASIAGSVARSLGLDGFSAGLLPQDKVRELEGIMAANGSGRKTAFIGDGINDAPVLARADIGIAMGGLGSDAALEAADVVLMEDEPEKLLTAVQVAGRTRSIVWQNIALALGVKLCVLGLGVLGLATMWQAVFADVGVALLAILNALRINFIRGTG